MWPRTAPWPRCGPRSERYRLRGAASAASAASGHASGHASGLTLTRKPAPRQAGRTPAEPSRAKQGQAGPSKAKQSLPSEQWRGAPRRPEGPWLGLAERGVRHAAARRLEDRQPQCLNARVRCVLPMLQSAGATVEVNTMCLRLVGCAGFWVRPGA